MAENPNTPLTLEAARKVFPPMWVIYDHPSDFPNDYVVRLCWGMFKEPDCAQFQTLIAAREYANENGGCFCIPRDPDDDPVIVETWL